MRRGSMTFLQLFIWTLVLTGIFFGQGGLPSGKLEQILEKAGAYCEKLKGSALHFTCHEKIEESIFELKYISRMTPSQAASSAADVSGIMFVRKVAKNSFLYDYQMIKKGEELAERRNLIAENGRALDEKDVPLKAKRASSKFLAYGPVGFLSLSWQAGFRYEISGSDRLNDRKIVVVRASPKEAREENYSFGRLWIAEDDGSVHRIEWEPASFKEFKETVKTAAGELKRTITCTVSYDLLKNGLRFPSSQRIKETCIGKGDRAYTVYEADYRYLNYRFFTVETEVRYDEPGEIFRSNAGFVKR